MERFRGRTEEKRDGGGGAKNVVWTYLDIFRPPIHGIVLIQFLRENPCPISGSVRCQQKTKAPQMME